MPNTGLYFKGLLAKLTSTQQLLLPAGTQATQTPYFSLGAFIAPQGLAQEDLQGWRVWRPSYAQEIQQLDCHSAEDELKPCSLWKQAL